MVKVFHKIASSPRRLDIILCLDPSFSFLFSRACLVTLSICLLLFNDDYAIVLITGYSMSKVYRLHIVTTYRIDAINRSWNKQVLAKRSLPL